MVGEGQPLVMLEGGVHAFDEGGVGVAHEGDVELVGLGDVGGVDMADGGVAQRGEGGALRRDDIVGLGGGVVDVGGAEGLADVDREDEGFEGVGDGGGGEGFPEVEKGDVCGGENLGEAEHTRALAGPVPEGDAELVGDVQDSLLLIALDESVSEELSLADDGLLQQHHVGAMPSGEERGAMLTVATPPLWVLGVPIPIHHPIIRRMRQPMYPRYLIKRPLVIGIQGLHR
ncbi:hypothetical protein L7F22_003824 [Adiantum nelumboides]|nr:hypothetical protein [Adiantum nelumboides]